MATSALDRLKDLVNKLGAGLQPSTHSFLQLDVPRIKREMDLAARGKEKSQREILATDSAVPDEIEQEIGARIDNAAREAHEQLLNQLNTYNERLKVSNPAVEAAEISFAAREAIAAFRASIATVGNELYPLRQSALENARELKSFRDQHRLTRVAHYPQSALWHIAVIMVLFLVESIPNAMFLGENDQFGLLGGWTSALVFSFLSLGVAFLTGWLGWRAFCHSNAWIKTVGFISTVLLTAVVVTINLALAHFRVASAGLSPDAAAAAALHSLKSDPLGLADLKSWGMAGLGLLFAFIVMIDGFSFDDRFPGYGAASRRRTQAITKLNDATGEAMSDLSDQRDEYAGLLRAAVCGIRDQRQTIAIVLDRRRRLIDLYRAHLDHLEQAGRQLLSEYREAIRIARSTPTAAQFEETWHFNKRSVAPELDDEVWTASITGFDMGKVAEELRSSVEILHQEFEAAAARIGTLEELFRDGGAKDEARYETPKAA